MREGDSVKKLIPRKGKSFMQASRIFCTPMHQQRQLEQDLGTHGYYHGWKTTAAKTVLSELPLPPRTDNDSHPPSTHKEGIERPQHVGRLLDGSCTRESPVPFILFPTILSVDPRVLSLWFLFLF